MHSMAAEHYCSVDVFLYIMQSSEHLLTLYFVVWLIVLCLSTCIVRSDSWIRPVLVKQMQIGER